MKAYEGLNDEQNDAVVHTEGPVLILAGAGSGKTRTLAHRIAYLISHCKVNPWNILAITFTNKAAGEMRERVNSLVGYGAEAIWVMTFHAACVRILRRYIDRLGYDPKFTVYDSEDQKSVMKQVCKRLNIDTKSYKERVLLGAISSAKDNLISAQEYENSTFGDFTKVVIARAYREYQEELKRSNALDFDDIICLTVELFRKCPDVLEIYQERFRYIHVDEYQDTNMAQFELVRLLADRYRNLCVVGDDDQSIYRFRGANIRNILDFEEHYPDAHVVRLEQNYRSTQVILDAANAVIKNNRGRKEKALWTDREGGDKIRFEQCDSAYEEAGTLVDDIRSRVRKSGESYSNFAILYRTNAQARVIEEKMVMSGIPYNVVGGTNFYSRMEIKDILAYLKTIDSGMDEVALRRVLNVPKRSIGAASLGKLTEYADIRDLSLWDAMCQAGDVAGLGRTAQKILDFVKMIAMLRNYMEDGIAELIRQVVDRIGYEEYLKDYDEETAEDRIANVDELITKATVFEEEHEEASLTDFLEEVALVSDLDNVDSEDGRVLLMTLHSAKGLEFPHVYLAGLEDGLFPNMMVISADSPEEMEEERRLAYVGITRAQDDLMITCAKMRMQRGETQFNAISRFVREIPSELLQGYVPKQSRRVEYENDVEFRRERPKIVKSNGSAPEYVKPYILKTDSGLGLSGIPKGGQLQGGDHTPDYSVGDRVRHKKFGAGTVVHMVNEGKDYKVTVNFDAFGNKIMYAAFAKLEKI